MDKAITVGTPAVFHVCGSHYDHVVTAVLSPKKVVICQGTPDNVFGPPEVFTLRNDGLWRRASSSPNSGYATIYPR